ncbi:MAG: NBR1-Ig-like domain-containing protein [bacterium]|nr:NBR1-Ig-like domain-containing protein [bacterium]
MVSIPWRTGVNMREFAYYGYPGLPNFFAPAALQRQQAETLRGMGVKVVRFYASHRQVATDATAQRVRAACDVLAQHGMQAIICLDDAHAVAGWCVPGYDDLHTEVNSHYNKRFFTQELWRAKYLPHISAIVTAVKDHPGVLLFELGNEYAIHPRSPEPNRADAQAFITFARVVSETIKAIAPKKLVSTGLVNTRHVANLIDEVPPRTFSRQLHALPGIDAISLHYYFHDGEKQFVANDMEVARALGKPFYIGEFGAEFGKVDRLAYYRAELQEWRSAGAFVAMPWAFDTSPNDVGVSDLYSFARIKGDFDALRGVVQSFSTNVPAFELTPAAGTGTQPQPTNPTPTPPTPAGTGTPPANTGTGTGSTAGGTTPNRATGTLTPVAGTFSSVPAFVIQSPAPWQYDILARFNEPAAYGKREGLLIKPKVNTGLLTVNAVQRGRVTKIENYPPGYGLYVCIEHRWYGETYVSWYGHLAQSYVKVGDYVNAGSPVGVAGDSGSADVVSLFLTLQWLGKGGKGYVIEDVIDPLAVMQAALPPRDEVTFDAHVTVPDNTVFQAGAIFKKTWRVRNTGNTTWQNYQLTFFSGTPMGPGTAVPIPVVRPGELVQLSVDLVAPSMTGNQVSRWAIRNAAGQIFRSELTAAISVQGREQGTRRSLARFVADVTIPDGSPIAPGQRFTKTWRVMNDGNTTWDGGYRMSYESGERMNTPNDIPLPALRPRQVGDVSVDLVAPTAPGRYRVTYQPFDSAGQPFDFDMYAEITVDPAVNQPRPVNSADILPSPVRGNYTIGWKFNAPVPYLDGRHKGVDYVARGTGNPIFAGAEGVVFSSERCGICTPDRPNFAAHGISIASATAQGLFNRPTQWNFGFGNLVIVRYDWSALPKRARDAMAARNLTNGFAFVFYAHLLDIFVSSGQAVNATTQIGTLGNSGNSTGPHLHLEVRLGRESRDYLRPIQLLDPELMFGL